MLALTTSSQFLVTSYLVADRTREDQKGLFGSRECERIHSGTRGPISLATSSKPPSCQSQGRCDEQIPAADRPVSRGVQNRAADWAGCPQRVPQQPLGRSPGKRVGGGRGVKGCCSSCGRPRDLPSHFNANTVFALHDEILTRNHDKITTFVFSCSGSPGSVSALLTGQGFPPAGHWRLLVADGPGPAAQSALHHPAQHRDAAGSARPIGAQHGGGTPPSPPPSPPPYRVPREQPYPGGNRPCRFMGCAALLSV